MPQPKKAPIKTAQADSKPVISQPDLKPVASISSHSAYDGAVVNVEDRIRRRAYEFYEQRGRQDGFADQDWLRAETEVRATHKLSA